ncbi:MAG: hypothetical protein KBD10_00375 [Candidatus Pacebacteria bacterium]|nr:hypothetical protein [Candidatus Paceibacterota bacterium]
MFFLKYKKIIIILLVLIVSFILYTIFFKKDPQSEDLLVSSSNTDVQTKIVGDEIISALNKIETLKLDKGIFTDPVFQSLVDRSVPIPAEPVGKSNPFAPIGSGSILNKSTTTKATTTKSTTPKVNTFINTTNTKPATATTQTLI